MSTVSLPRSAPPNLAIDVNALKGLWLANCIIIKKKLFKKVKIKSTFFLLARLLVELINGFSINTAM